MMSHLIIPGNFRTSLLVLILILTSSGILCQNVDLDKELGAENHKIVEAQMGLVSDEELSGYVSSIGNRLVPELEKNPFDFQFFVADDPIPNAFALPGGYVYVTRGILSLLISEDELACVMGHEIIHVTERHSIKQMRSSVIPNLLELPGNIVGTVVSDDLGRLLNTPIHTSNSLFLSSYSRKHETESDTRGIELASKAGYDPVAMGSILERLSLAFEVITNEKEEKSYFDSHPYTPDRVNKINKSSEKLEWEEKSWISEDFPAPIDGMVFGYNPAKGIFREEVFLHPDLNFTITFPEGWETFNQASTVGAIHEDRQAGLFVGIEDPSLSPEEYGKKFEQEIEKEHGQKPSRSEPRTINNNPGYVVSMTDNSGREPMYIHVLWLKMGGKMFKLIGLAPKAFESDLQKSARSLRPMTSDEKTSIWIRKVRLVNAKKKESLEELNERTGNVLKPKGTAIINGLEEKPKLEKDQVIKIVVREKYIR
jgi:predicted Zn-dependent protease